MTTLLSEEEITGALASLAGWRHVGQTITRTVKLPTFPDAISLVSAVADVAERMNHHPDIDIRWRTVHFVNSTHSQGGITTLDIELADAINTLVESVNR